MVKRRAGIKEKSRIYNDYVNGTSFADLSKQYGRPIETIEKCVKDYSASLESNKSTEKTADVTGGLHSRHFWAELKKQLSQPELRYFEKSWANLIRQFSQYEVVETDEMIIKDLIVQDILCNRKLTNIKQIERELNFYQDELDKEFAKTAVDRNIAKVENCMRHLSELRGNLKDIDKSYADLQQRKETKFRDMKSTRDKRFKEIEDSKKTFFELIKGLDTIGKRKEDGEWMALMDKAVKRETAKMSLSHQYDDDSYDQPLLTPETV